MPGIRIHIDSAIHAREESRCLFPLQEYRRPRFPRLFQLRKPALGILLAAIAFSGTTPCEVSAADSRERKIKAAYIYNFAKFVKWPEEIVAEATQPVRIGILGEDPLARTLERAVEGKTVQGRPLAVREFKRVEDLETCHILFISTSEEDRFDQVIEKICGSGTLVVADNCDLVDRGCHIAFLLKGNKLKFAINLAEAKKSGLKVSSKLLDIAVEVRR